MISYLNKVFIANFYDRHGRARRTDNPIASVISHFRSRTIAVGSKIPQGASKLSISTQKLKNPRFFAEDTTLKMTQNGPKVNFMVFRHFKISSLFCYIFTSKMKIVISRRTRKIKKIRKIEKRIQKVWNHIIFHQIKDSIL